MYIERYTFGACHSPTICWHVTISVKKSDWFRNRCEFYIVTRYCFSYCTLFIFAIYSKVKLRVKRREELLHKKNANCTFEFHFLLSYKLLICVLFSKSDWGIFVNLHKLTAESQLKNYFACLWFVSICIIVYFVNFSVFSNFSSTFNVQ